MTCVHYLAHGETGSCRESPPQIAVETREEMRPVEGRRLVKHTVIFNVGSYFPQMTPVGSCGRHKQREVK